MKFIELIGDWIHSNLVFTVALAIIPLKLMMIRLCRDRNAELETALAIPEDLCYISIGLILSSLSAGTGPLQNYFYASKHVKTDVAIVLTLNFFLVLLVHRIAQRWTKPQYMSWRAAIQVRGDNASHDDPQMELALEGSEDNLLHILLHHFLGLLFTLFLQFSLVGFWLYNIAAIYSSR